MKQGLKFIPFKEFMEKRNSGELPEPIRLVIQDKEFSISESVKKKIMKILKDSDGDRK